MISELEELVGCPVDLLERESVETMCDVLTRLPSMTNRQIKDIPPKAWAVANKATVTRKAA